MRLQASILLLALTTAGASTMPAQTPAQTSAPSPAQTPTQTPAPAPHPSTRDARIAAVIPYTAPSAAHPLTMDLYAPAGPVPHPAVIIIHGGGFVEGTSRNGSEAYAADFLAPAGYAVFSINYRLSPTATLPDMVADTERAVRFIRHNAAQYQVDPNKIALLGGSAGGYLSNMAGLLPSSTNASVFSGPSGDHPVSADPAALDAVDRESAAVEAVVTLFGISDLARMPPSSVAHLRQLLAPAPASDNALLTASPIAHVGSHAPPFLFIHGDRDQSVPIAQSLELQQALQKAGVRADLITIPNGPHATGSWYRIPGVPDWERQTVQWLNQVLHHTGDIGPGIQPRDPQF